MFFMHLSPDSALHLIFARDLLDGLPRFDTHLDNKGPAWTWIVTGMSLLTGPNFRAMSTLQVLSYATVAVAMYIGAVRLLDRRAAITAVLLWLILIHNPAMTGAGGRVEDLLVGVSALAWLCAMRITPMRFAFLGVLAGVAVMTKLTAGVAITLLAILSLIATDRSSSTPRPMAALCYLLGLIISAGSIILIVAATDNMERMIYQVFVFPVVYTREQFPTRPIPVIKAAMLMRLGMLLPLLLACYGAREMWRTERETTKHRLVVVTLAWGTQRADHLVHPITGRGLPLDDGAARAGDRAGGLGGPLTLGAEADARGRGSTVRAAACPWQHHVPSSVDPQRSRA